MFSISQILLSILPVFITISIGIILYQTKLIKDDMWSAIEHLCYYVLFPVLIIKALITVELTELPFKQLGISMLLAIITLSGILIITKNIITNITNINNATFSSLFQGATRWNGFMAMSIISALYGNKGIAITTIGFAVMIPALNVINLSIITYYTQGTKPSFGKIFKLVSKNPFIIACFLGTIINLINFPTPKPIITTMELIAGGALGLALLSSGAAIRPKEVKNNITAILIAVILKLLLFPLIMYIYCYIFAVDYLSTHVAIICACVPTAASAYILARQLGGNATFMANITAAQIIISTITIPTIIWLSTN